MTGTDPSAAPSSLYEALRQFQSDPPFIDQNEKAEVKTKKKDGSPGPTFTYDYVGLRHLMDLVLPRLTALGLVWITKPVIADGRPALQYKLVFPATGEVDEGTMPLMLAQGGPQDLGSAITYGRRYAVVSVLGLAPDKDEDAQKPQETQQRAKKVTEAYARRIAGEAEQIGVLDRLSLAAGHVRGESVGPTGNFDQAVTALKKLDMAQADKLMTWLDQKRQEAIDA
jgi:hypothetical protein